MSKISLMIIAIIASVIISKLKISSLQSYNCNGNCNYPKLSVNILRAANYSASIAAIVINIERDYKKSMKLKRNKIAHAYNGNKSSKVVVKSHIKAVQINKGNSNFRTKKNLIQNLVNVEKPDVLVISEANFESDNKTMHIDFKGYNVESKFLGDSKLARIIVMINSNLTYERLYRYETKDNSMIVLKIRLSTNKFLHMLCIYRQWKLLHTEDVNSNKLEKQLDRLRSILSVITKIRADNKELIMLGDVNIDLWAPNDPGQRPEIKALSEEYLSVLNQTAMCHPQKIDGVETKKNIIADHCTVRCQYHAKDLKIRQKQI